MVIEIEVTVDLSSLRTILPRVVPAVGGAVGRAAESIATRERERILEPPKTGVVYLSGPAPLPHQASAPGQSPANWTGALAEDIVTEHEGLEAWVTAASEYAPYLEFGTKDMAPRPFVQPSVDEIAPLFADDTADSVRRALG